MKKNNVLESKAVQSQLIYEDLIERFGFHSIPTTFVADENRQEQFEEACREINPYPFPFSMGLDGRRKPAVKALFEPETIVQTPAIAALLAACSSVATEIAELRGADVEGAETYCDVAFAGMQAIRLLMPDYSDKKFAKVRLQSTMRVDNAFDGTKPSGKYTAADGRQVSFHVFYQSQLRKLVKALELSKPAEKYTKLTMKKDVREIAAKVSQKTGLELEELSFACGASGCMLRSREEWENTEVGKAVMAMPLVREIKKTDCPVPNWGKPGKRGPLSGLKVLDLTHIIAGPVCSRLLAEYGADVLLIRRGKFMEQEQATTEFDGWAGKHSIQLDFNLPSHLEKAKELIKEADIITYSYQNGALDKFGLSEADIRRLNPNVIYANMMCFSDTVWKQRPGWAPLAEDITGLSIRNGSAEQPKNLNGVPLDYIPGMILTLGTLCAIARKLREGGGYKVTTSLTRGAQYLHECSDLCQTGDTSCISASRIAYHCDEPMFDNVVQYVGGCAIKGRVGFPTGAAVNTAFPLNAKNLRFTDGNTGWSQT